MKIAFITSQSANGSTVAGRIMPLAGQLAVRHKVYVIGHGQPPPGPLAIVWHNAGPDPFSRLPTGKIRLKGWRLAYRMLHNARTAALALKKISPDILIISKPLPEGVTAAWLGRFWFAPKKIILDVDDFELTANTLASLVERAAVHASERIGAHVAQTIVTASPFLSDHMRQLTQDKKSVTMIPTGLTGPPEAPEPAVVGAPVITFIGSLSIHSGHRVDLLPDILLTVLRTFPATTLRLIGSGDDAAALRSRFQELGLTGHVIWHAGRFSAGDATRLLAGTAVLLDPIDSSITNRAKSSYRLMLALWYGLPIVTSNVGIRSIVLPADFHGRSFARPGDAFDYAQKIIDCLKTPLSKAEQAQLLSRAQEYSWTRLAAEYEKLLQAS